MNANRRILGRAVVLATFCGLLFFGMSAFGYDVGDFSFEITNWETQEARLTGYNGTSSYVSIPSSFIYTEKYKDDDGEEHTRHRTMTVTGIDGHVFTYNTTVSHITIPNSIVWMSSWRPDFYGGIFEGCTELQSVSMSRNLHDIESYAFRGCSKLESIDLSSVINLNIEAFAGCSGLKSIGCSLENASRIWSGAFEECSSLSVELNLSSIEILGPAAFAEAAITKVRTGTKLRTLNQSIFRNCFNLEEAIIDGTIISRGKPCVEPNFFQGCGKLRRVELIANNLGFRDYSYNAKIFEGCNNLKEVVLGRGFTYVMRNCFQGLINLKKVSLTSSTKEIGSWAFSGCTSLNEISLDNVVTISEGAFENCTSLPNLSMQNIVTLGGSAFKGCTNLQSVMIGSRLLLSWGDQRVFENCTSLKRVTITGKGGCTLPNYTFSGCSKLETCIIGDGFSSICSLDYHYSSPFEYCNNLRTVSMGRGITELPRGLFEELPSLETCNLSSVTNIGSSAFSKCYNLKNVTSMEKVESIGGSAFYQCSNLVMKLDLPAVKVIGESSFAYCRGLTGTVNLASIESLSNYSFLGCDGLRSMVFGKNLSTLDGWAFTGSTNLVAFAFEGSPPENVNYRAFVNVGKGAFGVYPASQLDYSSEAKASSVRLLSASASQAWEDVIPDDGIWNGLIMAANKPTLTNDSYNVTAGSLHLNWESKRTTKKLLDAGVTYEVRRGFTDSYESADILTNGYKQLAYEDKQFDFTGGVSRIWYWVKPEHDYVKFETSESCRTKNRYAITLGVSDGGANRDAERFAYLANKNGFEVYGFNALPDVGSLREKMFYYVDKLKSGDIFCLFIGAHGDDGLWMIDPSLTMGGFWSHYTASEMKEDSEKVASKSARFIGIIMACHSQAMILDGHLVKETEALEKFCNDSCGEGSNDLIAWIASCRKDQQSYFSSSDYTRFGRSFIKYGWEEGYADVDLWLEGEKEEIPGHGDGRITLLELAHYAAKMAVGGASVGLPIPFSPDGNSSVYIQNPKIMANIDMGEATGEYMSGQLEPPKNVFLSDSSTFSCTIKWSSVKNAMTYRVYRYTDDPDHPQAVHLDVDATALDQVWVEDVLFRGFRNRDTYKYYVQSANPAGLSKRSNIAHEISATDSGINKEDFKGSLTENGINVEGLSDDELESIASSDLDGDGISVEHEYIAGASPTDATSKFSADITIEGGKPKVTPNPDLGDKRVYTVYGKKRLDSADESWEDMSTVSDDEQPEYHFFKVGVSLP